MPSTAHCSFSTYKRGTCLLKLYTENLTPCNHRTTTLKGKPGKNEQPLKGLIYHLKAAPSPTHCQKKKKKTEATKSKIQSSILVLLSRTGGGNKNLNESQGFRDRKGKGEEPSLTSRICQLLSLWPT